MILVWARWVSYLLSSSHAWALLGVQVKEDIFKRITILRYFQVDNYPKIFQVDNYPRWHDDYPLLIFILDSQVAFGTKWTCDWINSYSYIYLKFIIELLTMDIVLIVRKFYFQSSYLKWFFYCELCILSYLICSYYKLSSKYLKLAKVTLKS
jgi:hypothetical protein